MGEDRQHNRDAEFSRPLVELISAYLDDRESLSSMELERVEDLLDQDPEAQQISAELRVITSGLRDLDPVAAPRSYHLDAEMVGAPEPVVLQESTAWYVRHTQKVRWATAAAAILFVFVLGADLVLNGVLGTGDGEEFPAANRSELSGSQPSDLDSGAGDGRVAEDSASEAGGESEDVPGELMPEISADADDAVGDEDSDTTGTVIPPEVAEEEAVEEEGETFGGESEPQAESRDGSDALASPQTTGDSEAEPSPGVMDENGGDAVAEDEAATDDAPEETAETLQALRIDQNTAASSESEDSDRRFWRIAEFSLVVLLGLLITALVVLPRLGGNAASQAGDNQ